MNYPQTLDFLYQSLPMFQRVGKAAFKKDLTNIILLCEHLGNPHNKFRSVHIAGTNGKGSSAHMLASVFQEAGYITGLYTSPHLKNFTERIRINGMEIPKEAVVKFVGSNISRIREIKPSFFEISVAMAFWHFAENNVDMAIIEVGLGGRLDSTNIITPEVSLITNISLDHTDMLGNTIKDIAHEKGGIIKEQIPVVIGESMDQSALIFKKLAAKKSAPIIFANDRYACNKEQILNKISNKEQHFEITDWPDYQYNNLPGVLTVLDTLRKGNYEISELHIKLGIERFKTNTFLKGRWQILENEPLTICDTAHNEAGIEAIVKEIKKIPFVKLYVVWGMVVDKEVKGMIRLFPEGTYFYFCRPDIPRGMPSKDMYRIAMNMGIQGEIVDDVNEAVRQAKSNATNRDMIFIGGSTFVVAELEQL